mmetsp:Transcript_20537/g.63887  ORF Transcript_20537/g.63887 Transcript_20537/m.63887 type:complete len:208 (-) Transcript_20537:652-1275(-)
MSASLRSMRRLRSRSCRIVSSRFLCASARAACSAAARSMSARDLRRSPPSSPSPSPSPLAPPRRSSSTSSCRSLRARRVAAPRLTLFAACAELPNSRDSGSGTLHGGGRRRRWSVSSDEMNSFALGAYAASSRSFASRWRRRTSAFSTMRSRASWFASPSSRGTARGFSSSMAATTRPSSPLARRRMKTMMLTPTMTTAKRRNATHT